MATRKEKTPPTLTDTVRLTSPDGQRVKFDKGTSEADLPEWAAVLAADRQLLA